jgi:hypothetical protein
MTFQELGNSADTSDQPSAAEPTIGAFEFRTALAQSGLGRYEETLQKNGFLGWEEAAKITESDLAGMGFRLGDRRKLQRLTKEFFSSTASKVCSLCQIIW